ncbi:hypothetical protein [Muricoccus aerilatus]|uniref:hypothetical protein n=1 Tax=Muricoccus aerilatus TaxID=452982 RepID=UPI0012EB74B3|nr:hypothetical protein [Roseomonas aerilata]
MLISREMAALRAERQAEALARARRAVAPEPREDMAVDRGAQGPAMLARGFQVETVEADVSMPDGTQVFERTAVARVHEGVLDHYAKAGVLVGRNLTALRMLAKLYHIGRIAPGTGRGSGPRGHGEMTDGQARAWADYCHATDHLSTGVRATVEDVARDRFPTTMDSAAKLRRGAWELADLWRLPADKIP